MDLSGKIGKAILWSALGFVAWLVIDHYFHVGMPSTDSLTNFFVFLAIGGAIYFLDQQWRSLWHWLRCGDGRKVAVAAGWIVSVPVLVTYFHTPAFAVTALPFHVPTPMPLVGAVGLFVAYQAYRLVMWVLF